MFQNINHEIRIPKISKDDTILLTDVAWKPESKELLHFITWGINISQFSSEKRTALVSFIKEPMAAKLCNDTTYSSLLKAGVTFNYTIEFSENSGTESVIVSKSDCKK